MKLTYLASNLTLICRTDLTSADLFKLALIYFAVNPDIDLGDPLIAVIGILL